MKAPEEAMKVTLRNSMTFDYAHVLPTYQGKCSRLHGHTATVVEFSVEGEIDPGTSMVVDFAVLKRALRDVLDRYDHKFLIGEKYVVSGEEECVITFPRHCISLPESEVMVLPGESTIEVITHEIGSALSKVFPSVTLELSEGTGQSARWSSGEEELNDTPSVTPAITISSKRPVPRVREKPKKQEVSEEAVRPRMF